MSKNSFERASERKNTNEDNIKKIKAFRSEIYQNLERNAVKKNAFTMATRPNTAEKQRSKQEQAQGITKDNSRQR